MTTKVTTSVVIEGASRTDGASFSCDSVTFKRNGSITITHNGVTLSFSTVAELAAFTKDVILPLLDKTHDVTGAGTAPFAPASAGVAGPNALQD